MSGDDLKPEGDYFEHLSESGAAPVPVHVYPVAEAGAHVVAGFGTPGYECPCGPNVERFDPDTEMPLNAPLVMHRRFRTPVKPRESYYR